jgi:hypothetical protein
MLVLSMGTLSAVVRQWPRISGVPASPWSFPFFP